MPETGKSGPVPLSSSLPLDATPSNSLAVSTSLPAPQNGLPPLSQTGSGSAAASTGSLRGAVRALFRTAGTNGNSSAKEGSAAPPSEAPAVEQPGSKNNFSDVSLSDSPRAVTYTAISRNSAQNIPAPAVMAAPSRSPMLSKPPPMQKPKKQQHNLAAPSLGLEQNGSSSAPSASAQGGPINTFQVGQRREAPPPGLLSQHHVRSSSGGSRLEVLASHPSYEQSPAAEASEKASLLNSMASSEGNGENASDRQHMDSARPTENGMKGDEESGRRPVERRRGCCGMQEPLLFATLVGVVVGIVGGVLLRMADLSPEQVDLLGFLGELMLRLLKMLVLPLVAGSMVAGVCALRGSASGMAKVARLTLGYYTVCTAAAVVLGIILVTVIEPGQGSPLSGGSVTSCHTPDLKAAAASVTPTRASPLQALLAVARNMVPDNVVLAAVNMNILGIITFSLFFGICLASLGDQADGFISLITVFNTVIGKMVSAVLWTSPLGIASLIAAAICRACSLLGTLGALGLWLTTVIAGLVIFGVIILPLAFWFITRRKPTEVARGFSKALVLAFGTSSSSAALPVAMECAKEMGCKGSVVDFVMPLGTTVNMNGTALYEATTVIFLAQAHGVALGLGNICVIALTATLAAIGAAAIPSAGLVTMLMVLQAVSLDRFAADLAVILALDWLLDRCRTAINLLGDAFGVVMIDHLTRHASAPAGSTQSSQLELT
ncbi:g11310 [Coccomyxa viridis]|uniref:Amino acid transporter n=1 Tax=Coccomyxa viridis TaxID=1274662 RepID=A0ABP1GA68_9CHLO